MLSLQIALAVAAVFSSATSLIMTIKYFKTKEASDYWHDGWSRKYDECNNLRRWHEEYRGALRKKGIDPDEAFDLFQHR